MAMMSKDAKIIRLQGAVLELCGWIGVDVADFIEQGLLRDGDME